MNFITRNAGRLKRRLCLLLACVMLLGLVPTPSLAADAPQSSISLNSITWTSGNYQSAYFERPCQIQDFHMNVGGQTLSGFCGDHSKHLNNSHIGDSWNNPREITNSVVKTMMSYYYTHLLGEDYWNDECIAKGFNYVVSGDAILQYNGWIQEVVWLWSTDQIPSDHDGQVEIVAQAYRESFDARNGTHHASIDDQVVSDNPNTFRDVTELILSNPGAWCECPVYEYFHGDSTVQPILVGFPQKVTRTPEPEEYAIIVKKVDAENPDLPLPGAVFRLASVTIPDFTPQTGTTGADGTYTFSNLAPGTYTVTETAAPSGYTIDTGGPDYVTLPGTGNTVTKVFTDTPTITVSGSIRKVDADNPSRGLAGATIAIQGVDNPFYGEYQTGNGGALEGLDWNSLVPGSYRAWEVSAPEGYSLDPSDVKTFRISRETPEVQLVFKDDAKVRVELVKLDDSDHPLPGAVFNILKDGQIIATKETDASGKITVTDVETGMYAFVEVAAPAGYAKLDEPVCVYVNQADIEGGGLITVTAADKKLPDLTIEKRDGTTGNVIPGTVFEIRGIHSGYQMEATTGADGKATLTSIPVDYYEVTEKSVPAPYVLGDERTQTVWLGAGEHPTLVFNNLEEPELSILKIDAETSSPIAGVVFNVQGIDVDYEADWTTGDDGRYTAQVEPGSYRITETSVPAPYTLDSRNVRTVSLTAGVERELVFENLKNPLLNLVKIDALDGRVIPGTVFQVTGIDNSYSSQWTTGTDGTVSERVEPGTYRVTEVSVPAPYYLPENEADRVQTISLVPGAVRSVVFKDYRTPTLTIYKLDSVSGAPVEGAQFHVTYTRVSSIPDAPATYDFGILNTNADGEIPLHETGVRLFPGQYTVEETAPAPGFQLREPTTQTVMINGSESRSVTFYNAPLNAIIVQKVDSVTGLAVPGATFRLRYLAGTSGTDGTVIGTKTTGASGSAIWTGLEPGTYVVEEISAPSGYNITLSTQTVHLAANGEQSVVTVSFENTPNGGLLVRKVDAKTGLPMAGIEFLVTDSRGTFIGNGNGKFVTDAEGTILIGDVAPGTTLVVRETRTLPGYILDTTPQTAVIQEGRTTTLTFRNEPGGTIIVYKKDAVTGASISGVQFQVTTGSGEFVAIADGTISSNGIYFTDENGQIILSGLKPDTYVFTETATVSGYVLDPTPHVIAVTAGDTQTLTLTNQPASLLLLQKFDRVTRTPLAGAEFRIVPADSALAVGNEGLTSPTGLYMTDEDGQILLENLIPGAYIITETQAPEGYALDSEAQTVVARSGRTETVRFYDSALTTLQILKRDAVSHQPLANAEFTVTTADGTALGTNNGIYTTGEDGMVTVTGLQPNSAVIVSESTSPAGYVLNTTPQSIIVRSGAVNSLVFNDEPKTTLLVQKYIAGTRNEPLAGVEFKVTNSRGEVQGMNNGIYYTDANGDFMVTGLDPGLTVTVRETRTVDGYVLDGTPQSIQILAGDMQELTFWNLRKGTLIIRKLADDTGLPLAGVEFNVTYADGRPVDANNGHTSTGGRYVTDSRGEIVLNDVTGVIVVTETATVEGYAIDPAAMTQTVVVNPDDAQTLVFRNPRLQTLILTKYQTGTTTPIQGVTYLLTDGDGAVIGSSNGEYTTDRSGQIVVENLVPGTTVTAREISVPEEYVLDATPHTIRIRSGETQTLTLYNSLKGSIIIRKVVSATGEALPGAQFRVTTATGDAVTGYTGAVGSNGIFTTDRNGEITLNRLQPGAYTVREEQAPDGYVMDDQPQTVVLEADGTQTVTFANAPKGSLVIIKLDAVTGVPLAGAAFKVMTAAGTLVANNGGRISANGIYVTDDAGQITLTSLEPGAYVVTETQAPEGYHLSAESQTVEVTTDDVQTVRFSDEPLASLTIRKQDILTGTALAGAVFSVKDTEGREIGEYTTAADGSVTVTGLTPGTSVVVTETKAPSGYVLNDHPRTVAIRSGAANSVTFEDQPTATLLIRKTAADTGEPLSGVSFKVTDGSGANIGPDDGIFTTDHAGEIRIPGLTPGVTVNVREIEAAPGYVLDPVPQDVEMLAGQVQTLTFRDVRQGALVIRKLDAATNEPLAGVTFKITTATGEFVPDQNGRLSSNGLYRTDEAGEIILTGIVGTLVVTETETIPGYVIDETTRSQTVVVHPADTQTLTFFNTPKQSLTVQKYAAGTTTPLAGAEYLVTDSTGAVLGASNGVFMTDENGRFIVTDLEPGITVTVKETKAPAGYILDGAPKSIVIRSGEAQTLTMYDAPTQALIIQKYVSGTTEPIEGVRFHVTDQTGSPVGASNGDFLTDRNGQIIITDLTPGTTITATETETVEGFVLDPAPQSILIREGEVQRMLFFNSYQGSIHVYKMDSVTEQPLADAEFKITTVQGTPVDNYGGRMSTNGIYWTDWNGEISVEGLNPGVYTIAETRAPAGYVLDSQPQTVEVHEDDAQYLVFRNTPLQTLVIQKFVDRTSTPLPGVTFRLTDADGRSLGEYITDDAGQIVVDGLEPGSVVVVREIRTVEGYHLNTTPQTIRITVSDTVSLMSADVDGGIRSAGTRSGTGSVTGTGNSLTFYDVPLATLVIHKVADDTNAPLAGCEFYVTDGTGRAIGSTDGVYVTDENGEITIRNLEIGTTVRVRETRTLPGYVLDTTAKDIEIQSSDLHELTFRNVPSQTLVVQKFVRGTTTPIPGTEFLISDSQGTVLGSENGKFVTDEDGRIVVDGLTPGMTVTVRETRTADGYVYDGSPKSIAIQSGEVQTLNFYNTPKTTLTLFKYESGTDHPLPGVAFQITDGDGRNIGSGEYVTDASGRIFLDGLEPGLTVIAREVRTVRGYALNGAPQSIILKSDGENSLTFYDDPLSTLIIRKVIDGTDNEPLSGVEFKVVDGSGANVGESDGVFYTNAQGEIVITGLEDGTVVKARETKTVPGFVLDGTPQDIEIHGSDVHELVFWNRRQGGLTIRKLNSATNEPLAGAEFHIAYADGRPVDNFNGQTSSGGIYTTDANGEINITGVTGTIVVTEERAPAGFSLDAANRSQTVVVNPAETQTIVFRNAPDQSLVLQKYVKGTTTPIQGARFLVTDGDGRTVGENGGEFTTDESGRITVTGLKPGTTITAKEIEAAEGYVLDATPKSVTIRSGSVQQITFYNEPCGTLTIVKRDAETDEPLAGAVFQITNSRGAFVNANGAADGRYVTDDSGEIRIGGLDPMTVVVKEITAPEGYSLDDTPQTAEIAAGENRTLTFRDLPLQTLIITKYAEGTSTPLAGVVFLITDADGVPLSGGSGEYVTDANGRIMISGLPVGMTVVAREVRTVRGYHLNGTPQTIRIGAGGNAILQGAVGTRATSGNTAGTGTSGGNSMNFYDTPLATLVVRKFIDGTENEPLPGVQFKIVDGTGRNLGESDGVFYTNDEGEIVIENLEIGTTVKVRETKTVDGFVLDGTPKDIEIVSSDLHELTFWNQRQGCLTVRARDSVTGETLAGVVFRIVYADGRPVDNNGGQTSSNGIYTTNASGEINITGLTGTVVVTEQRTIDGYTMNPAGITQTVVVNPAETQTLDFFDSPNQTLTIQVLASDTGEALAGIHLLVTDSEGTVVGSANGEYVTDQNGRVVITNLVPGVTVTVKETESVSGYVLNTQPQSIVIRQGEAQSLTLYNDPKGSLTVRLIDAATEQFLTGGEFRILTAAGVPVDNNEGHTSTNGIYRVDEEGRITVTGLLPGVYTITQTKAPDGYLMAQEPQTVTVNADDAQTTVFRNTPLQTLVVQNYAAGTTTPLVGTAFLVTDGDGTVLGTENGVYRTDENGRFVVSGLRPGLHVHVQQTDVTDGYLLNGNPQDIEIRSGEAQSLTFFNEPCGTLVLLAQDRETGQPIQGVVFQVMDSNGAFVGDYGGALTSNGLYTSDESGQVILHGLEPAVLVVREVEAPANYVLNTEAQTVEINPADTQTLTFQNAPTLTVTVRMFVEGTTEPLAGVRFLITDGNGANIGAGEYATDENGSIVLSGVAPGTTVIAREVRMVDGYTLNGTPKTLETASGHENVLTFYAAPLSTLLIHVYIDGTDNEPIANVGFKVVDGGEQPIGPDDGVYYSDHTGTVTLTGLEPGVTVNARVFKIADGFMLDGLPQEIVTESGAVQELTFWAKRQGSLTVYARDSLTREGIPGVTFTVAYADGRPVGNGRYTTNGDGVFTINDISGAVIVTETQTANGYSMNPASAAQTVTVPPNETRTLDFYDLPDQSLTVQLYARGTTDPIPGARFLLTDGKGARLGNEDGEFATDENGRFTVSGIAPGVTVSVKQISTADGFLFDASPRTIPIRSSEAQSVTVYNDPTQTLTIRLYEKGTTAPIPGAVFLLRDSGGTLVGADNGRFTTNASGEFTITGLAPGATITATQTATVSGFVIDTAPQSILIQSGDAQTLVFENARKGMLTVVKRDAATDEPLQGAEFRITTVQGVPIDDNEGTTSSNGLYTTNAQGEITIFKLLPGTYTVTETKAPNGYAIDRTPQTVEVHENDSQTLTFRDEPLQVLTLYKYESGTTNPIAGVTFSVTDANGAPVGAGTYTTDESGRIAIGGLAPGMTIVARETRTVRGYVLNGEPQTIVIGSGATGNRGTAAGTVTGGNSLVFYDEPLSTLIIHCYLDGTENEPLANVGFKVVDGSGSSIGPDDGVYYTDHAGNITLTDLEPGVTVNARIFKIPAGFVLDGLPQDIVMESGSVQELTFWAKRQGALTVRVLDSLTREPVPGVEFSVKYADGRPVDTASGQQSSGGQYFTDTNGEISITGVTGTIVITEEQTVQGYTMDASSRSKTVGVNPAETQTLTFFDTPDQSLTVQLYARGTTDPISGARFLLTDENGAKLGNEDGEFTTDENGRFTVNGIAPGVTVSVKQTSTADGFLFDASPRTITIRSGEAQSVTVYNDPAQTLTVRLYEKGTTTPIPGAAFLLRDSGGSLVGTNNGEFTTDRNGEFTITGLTPGVTITGTQTATVSGYVLDSAPQSILIRSGEAQTLTYYNAVKGMLTVRKVDAVTDEPLQGAEFKITTVQGIPVDDHEGTTSSSGLYTTDAQGEITIFKLLPGTYTVTETKAPTGYTLDRTPQTVVVNENDSQTLTFRDTALQSLTIVKYEDGTTNPLAGVTFSVTDANGVPIGAGTYTTDASGRITVNGLTPGMTVVVRETRTVRGYVLNGEPQTIVIGNGGNAVTSGTTGIKGTAAGNVTGGNSLVFYDEPLSTLLIHKYVEGTDNEPLAGVEFSIVDGRGAAVGNGTYYTDASGEIRVENLQPGMTVTVRETKTVSGYVLDGTPKTATIPSGDVLDMVFWNSKAGNLVILKQDSETRQPLPGVEFSIHYADGTPVADENGQISSEGQYFTDENGEIRINGVVGTMIVTEENTIPGYTIDPNARTKTVTVNPNDTQTLTFFNCPKQTLVVQKYASGTTNPIAGAAFYITDSKGTALGQDGGEFVTDVNGRIALSDLTPGITVTARETRAASGYALDTTPKSIAIQRGSVQTLTFFNDPVQTVRIRKYVQGTTTPIPGVMFILTDGTGASIGSGEYTTNDNGEIVLNNIAPGTVINAREVRTATGYALNGSPQTMTVRNGENNVLTFYDEPLTTLVIRKYVEGSDSQPIPGTEFKVTDGTGAVIGADNGLYRTDAQGEIRIPNLQPGQTVTARETKAADGFVLDGTPQTIQIKSGEAQSLTFWNAPTQTLTIRKLVEGTTTPIPGTAFYITDQNAKPLGTANGEFTTDADGKIVLTGLTPGDSITIVETRAAEGYVLDAAPKSIVIRSGEAQTLNVHNKSQGTLIIIKRDKATEAPLKGAEFQVMTADGQFVPNAGGQLSSNGLYRTDDKGQIIITGLDTDTLVVCETKAPEGYLLDDQPQTVKVGPNDTQTLTFYNQPEKVLTVQKYESGTTKPIQGVVFLITDSTGATVGPDQGEYTTDRNGRIVLTGLTPGTTITAKEIRTVDGFVLDTTPQSILVKEGAAQSLTFYNQRDGGLELIKTDAADKTKRLPDTTFEIRSMDGGLVKKITTGRDGRIHTALDAGDYYLVEIEAADGYKVDPTPEYFTVQDGRTTTVTITNVAQSGILLHKTNAATGQAIQGVTFLLYDARNNPIGQYTTDNMGYIRIVDLVAGQYFLRELENKGYVPDTQMKTVYVKSGETTLVEWKNIPITAQIQITKLSADYNSTNGLPAGTPLEGAVFQIYDKAGNVVDTIQTDSRGVANSKPLPLDRYTFREVTAPVNYGVNENEFTAYLEHEGQIVRFEVTDKPLTTGVSINKTGPKEAMPGQPVNYRFDHIANTSNVRLDTFYWRDAIPAQLRLQKVVTGTYNFPGSYKITYRVNGSEPRTLADNLSTSRNYTLDASPTALGLASNEYVSEIMFVFGQAPAGFSQVEAPALYCTLIPNVLANSFANVADVGGVYNGQWVQGVTRWTTTVYRKPVKLPKTGY